MNLRWPILLLVFLVPLLALAALFAPEPLAMALNVLALGFGVIAVVLWVLLVRAHPAIEDDEMAHEVKNRVAANFVIAENAALLVVLIAGGLLRLEGHDMLTLIYAVLLLSVWAYGVAVAVTWRSLGK
jgi:hypothetical protein